MDKLINYFLDENGELIGSGDISSNYMLDDTIIRTADLRHIVELVEKNNVLEFDGIENYRLMKTNITAEGLYPTTPDTDNENNNALNRTISNANATGGYRKFVLKLNIDELDGVFPTKLANSETLDFFRVLVKNEKIYLCFEVLQDQNSSHVKMSLLLDGLNAGKHVTIEKAVGGEKIVSSVGEIPIGENPDSPYYQTTGNNAGFSKIVSGGSGDASDSVFYNKNNADDKHFNLTYTKTFSEKFKAEELGKLVTMENMLHFGVYARCRFEPIGDEVQSYIDSDKTFRRKVSKVLEYKILFDIQGKKGDRSSSGFHYTLDNNVMYDGTNNDDYWVLVYDSSIYTDTQ